ncbi:hypothetical protein PSTG_13342 [Puccinia striiformis f. sp. tritici PST-78]|uniref:SCP domain-containing protein n=3 Tax=Puccinia striiformis TaxID=27350 RepID=A0A0L0V1X2_9BASI|nr:hypothetical protein PSTG_13342 [Puccinia striiformis f. sp. tritici PST-78]QKO01442.1 secreted protein 13342 [Puccinia striiformis f. sp. tritici]
MAALFSGFATPTLVLLLLSLQLLHASPFESIHHKARWIKQKSVKAPYSTGLRVVPRPPIFNPVPHYQPHLKPAFPIGPSIVKPPTAKYGPGSPPMAQTFVDEHNKVRDVYGVPHLVWNSQLIPTAQRLAAACVFRHTDNNPYGENIAAGQTTPQDVVSQWVEGPEEKLAYNPNAPKDSHFTQVVWEASRELGCAVTSCPTMAGVWLPQSPIQFWVCEYNPSGNVDTLYTKNVHALAGGAPARR